MVFTVSLRKRIVTGVTDWGVRVHYVMKWRGLYQSVSHSVAAVVPEYRLPLRPAPLHTLMALPLGNFHSSPSCLFGPLRSFTSFYLNFTSCPFSVYYFLTSSSGSRRRGKEGKHTKRFGIFFFFFPPKAVSLKIPSASHEKPLQTSQPSFLDWSVHLCSSSLKYLGEAVEPV